MLISNRVITIGTVVLGMLGGLTARSVLDEPSFRIVLRWFTFSLVGCVVIFACGRVLAPSAWKHVAIRSGQLLVFMALTANLFAVASLVFRWPTDGTRGYLISFIALLGLAGGGLWGVGRAPRQVGH
jgi:hypothetical protein